MTTTSSRPPYCKCAFTDPDGTFVPGEACAIHPDVKPQREALTSKTESLADRFKAKFSQAHSQSRPLIISWELAVEIRDALSSDSPAPDTGLAGQIEAARARIASWPADVRAAMGLPDETTRDDARDAVRYRWLRDWYHREGKRAEIDPYGHIAVRTLPEWEALLDAAIARSSPEEPTQKPEDLRMEQVRACMRQYCSEQNGRRFGKSKVAAVKLYREIHGCGLKEAVLACEVLIPEKATARPIPPGRMCNTHGNWNCSECCPPENGSAEQA